MSPAAKRSPRRGRASSAPKASASPYELPEPELIVVAAPEARLRVTADGPAAPAVDVRSLRKTLDSAGATMRPLFGASEDRLDLESSAVADAIGANAPALSTYYRVEAPDADLEALAESLRDHEAVQAAYVKPPAEPPQINDMAPGAETPPIVTPDFTPRQGYLDVAPGGVDARFAWTLPGGRGNGVQIIDIEGAWRFTHEDLVQNQGGVIGGTQSTDIGWRNHGTAVNGEFGGDDNALGVSGICSAANVRAISIFPNVGSAAAIRQAANALGPGDIILIELHRPGPRNGFANRSDQMGYIAVEWWPDDFDAILFATGRGVIVVEAGGNGAENLDDALYNNPAPGFPAGWTNPFNRSNRDSGAILVGAGAPPPGTHGRTHGADRSRLAFSNYGALMDAQGWGREVTTCGYGDLQGGVNEDEWYTDQFSGTSSASPIVVGTLGALQGVLRARGQVALTPAQARQRLRSTGSPQQDEPGRPATQRIGNRPDLRQLAGLRVLKRRIKDKDKAEKTEGKDVFKREKLEKPEIKELKREKLETKELNPELEKRLVEEGKRPVEGKTLREGEFQRFRERVEFGGGGIASPSGEGSLADRVDRLESAVDELSHFILQEMRPDLGQGALGQEEDLEALSAQLEKDASDAKQTKDGKDIEKTSER